MGRFLNLSVLVPIGMVVFIWIRFEAEGFGWWGYFLKVIVSGFLISSVFGVWAMSGDEDDDEEERHPLIKLFEMIGDYGFFIAFAGFLALMGYVIFFYLPSIEDDPIVLWVSKGFYTLFVGGMLTFLTIDFLRSRKGSVELKLDQSEFSVGDIIRGTIHLRLNREIHINKIKVKLIGCVRSRQRLGNGHGSHTVEDIQCEYEQKVKAKSGPMSGKDNAFGFALKTDHGTIRRLLEGDQGLSWYVEAYVDCRGLDLSGRDDIYLELA